jgi:AhpD family alkylhydroperoxidase
VAWIRLLGPEDVSGEARAALDAAAGQYGQVLEAWRALAHRPDVLAAYFPYLRAVVGEGHVDRRIKDLTAIRIGYLNGCRYSVSHRVASARKLGVTDEDILGVAEPAAHPYDEPTAAALALADEMTVALPAASRSDRRQGVDPDVLARVEDVFDDAQRMELTLSISLWNALSRFHRTLDLDLDMPPPPPRLDPGP